MKNATDLDILIVGAGAIGGSIAAWLAGKHSGTRLLARGAAMAAIRECGGITIYPGDSPERAVLAPVRLTDKLEDSPAPNVVMIAVKLYDLEAAAQMVLEQYGDPPLVLGIQNGIANQEILPRYFTRVAYGIASYNAWVDAPGRIGYQTQGPLVIGTPDNSLAEEMQVLAKALSQGLEVKVTKRFQDAAHCKLAINLANSVTTLIGHHQLAITDLDAFQDLLAGTVYEGVRAIRAAGYREVHMGGLPSWATLWAAAHLPHALTRGTFRRNLKKMTLSSMGQDVFQHNRQLTELDYLNGYLLELAGRHGINVPYNQTIYRLCQEHFTRADFEPLPVRAVWEAVRRGLKG